MKGGVILALVLVALTPLLIVTLVIVGVATNPVRWEPPSLWSTQFGTTGPNVGDRVTSVSADANGLYAGGYVGQMYAGGPAQVFISRYDLSHRQLWSQLFGNATEANWINGLASDADGVYVAGRLNTGFVRKYDLQGNELWTDFLVSFASKVNSVSASSSGVYALGNYYGSSTSYNDTIALRGYESNGRILWTRTVIGGISVFAGVGGVYVSGYGYLQRYDYNGTLLWNHQLACACSPRGVSADGTGVYVAGLYGDLVNAFVAKYDFDGSQVWMRLFRPPNLSVVYLSMSADPSGIYMTIITQLGNYLSKYDGNGSSVWLFQIPLTPYDVSVGAEGVYIGGGTGSARVGQAALSEFGLSSSLIFFGLTPPFSFLAVGLVVVAVTMCILWLRLRLTKRVKRGGSILFSTGQLRVRERLPGFLSNESDCSQKHD